MSSPFWHGISEVYSHDECNVRKSIHDHSTYTGDPTVQQRVEAYIRLAQNPWLVVWNEMERNEQPSQ